MNLLYEILKMTSVAFTAPIEQMTKVNFGTVIIGTFIILSGIIAIFTIIGKFSEIIGKPVKWIREKREDHNLIIKTAAELVEFKLNNSQTEKSRDAQIQALITANREVLADRINQKYKYYISIGGIPEDEIDEFTSLHDAYKGVGGNHTGDVKFDYCINHLPIIHVTNNPVCINNPYATDIS